MSILRCTIFALAALGLVLVPAGGRAADAIQGSPGPVASAAPPPPNPGVVVSCDRPSSPRVVDRPPISVTVNAATAWQPREGEVLVAIQGESTLFAGLSFLACFSWSNASAEKFFTPEHLARLQWKQGFVMSRPSDVTGVLNVGIIVPDLRPAPHSIFDGIFSGSTTTVRRTGLKIVPVADMRLIGYTKDAVLFDEVRPIGITYQPVALLVGAATLALSIAILYWLAADPPPAGVAGPLPGTRAQRFRRRLQAGLAGNWILALVRTRDGRASLSSLQILLWTVVVATSAAYVMALSGNLINITAGTLTLLGIAGAAGLIATVADAPDKTVALGPRVEPQWRDLVIDPDSKVADISRIQMLLFTVVSAVFVVIQVLNYYVIPDIPEGYQILIGLSNGVYVGHKFSGTK